MSQCWFKPSGFINLGWLTAIPSRWPGYLVMVAFLIGVFWSRGLIRNHDPAGWPVLAAVMALYLTVVRLTYQSPEPYRDFEG